MLTVDVAHAKEHLSELLDRVTQTKCCVKLSGHRDPSQSPPSSCIPSLHRAITSKRTDISAIFQKMIEFHHTETKPTQQRKIPRKRRSVSGVYVFRGKLPIPYESSLERDFIIRTEFYLNVEEIIAQPVTISFNAANGCEYKYTPDFLVYRRPGHREHPKCSRATLVEVKPSESWRQNWRRWSPKWKAAIRYAKSQGWQFRISDELRIRDKALENIRWLSRFKRTEIDEEISERIMNDLEELGSAELDYLLNRHFEAKDIVFGQQYLWALLAQRYIDCDISLPLNGATDLWVAADG